MNNNERKNIIVLEIIVNIINVILWRCLFFTISGFVLFEDGSGTHVSNIFHGISFPIEIIIILLCGNMIVNSVISAIACIISKKLNKIQNFKKSFLVLIISTLIISCIVLAFHCKIDFENSFSMFTQEEESDSIYNTVEPVINQ